MSTTQYVFIDRAKLPSRDALQASIDSLGFDLKLDPTLDLLSDKGFSPCVFYGKEDVGFELLSEPAAEMIGGNPDFQPAIEGRDVCLSLIWRGSLKDCAAALIVSAALAKDFSAILSFDGQPPEPFDGLLEALSPLVDEARAEP